MAVLVHIYNKKLEKVDSIYTLPVEEFKSRAKEIFPKWEEGFFASEVEFFDPIIDHDTKELREKTREERILLNNAVELLQAGEKIVKGEIVTVSYKEDEFVLPRWNNESKIWEEGANKEVIMLERKNKILEYKKTQTEIKELEELEELFPSPETIAMLKKKLEEEKREIEELTKKIKKLK